MIAHVTGLEPGEFVHSFGDVHLYRNHFEQADTQLAREPRPFPKLFLDGDVTEIDDFTSDSFMLEGYNPHSRIKAEVAV